MLIRENTEVVLSILFFAVAAYMVAFAWNDFFIKTLDEYFTESVGIIVGRLVYAAGLTILVFIGLLLFIYISSEGKKKARQGVSLF